MDSVQKRVCNVHRIRFMSLVTTLRPPASSLVRAVVQGIGMDSYLACTAATLEPGVVVIHASMMAEALTVLLQADTTGRRDRLVGAALLHGIGWTRPDLWPTLPQPVSKWKAAALVLRQAVADPDLPMPAQALGTWVAEIYDEVSHGGGDVDSRLLEVVDSGRMYT